MTTSVRDVLRVFLSDPARERYGLDVCAEAGLASGTVYPILATLEELGWVESRWEDPEVHVREGRPRRRYYLLTSGGAEQARDAIAAAYRSRRQLVPDWARPLGSAGGAS
ncbi:hypothetical protein GCM10010149_27440 [Nonomuraea roseoviolacea subsp. roseoviolacea]